MAQKKEWNDLTRKEKTIGLTLAILLCLVVVGVIGSITGGDNSQTNNSDNISKNNKQAEVYTITGETLGEYGKEVTLNQNSDMPVKKYLYKLPAGIYKATTSFNKMASFFIVKDETVTESSNSEYPESLNYVGEAYLLTAGDNDFNGQAKKEVTITLEEDESVQVIGTNTFVFEKK